MKTLWSGGRQLGGTPALLLWGMADPLVPPVHLERRDKDLPPGPDREA